MRTSYGYARVSTVGQTLEAQLEGLKAADCQRIFREKVSGVRADRRELNKMIRELQAGDVVVVTRIDRLARSTFDLFAIVKSIVDTQGAISLACRTRGRYPQVHCEAFFQFAVSKPPKRRLYGSQHISRLMTAGNRRLKTIRRRPKNSFCQVQRPRASECRRRSLHENKN